MPWNQSPLESHLLHAFADDRVIGRIDERVGVVEEFQFLVALLLHALKILLVSRTQAGEDAYGGLDDGLQGIHLIWLRDGSLEDAYLTL